jgi:dihydrofolate reductase
LAACGLQTRHGARDVEHRNVPRRLHRGPRRRDGLGLSILAGRRSYDVGRKPDQRPEAREAFNGAWSGPQFILTHHPPTDEDDETITFLNCDIAEAVAITADAAGGNDVLVLGADIARQCIERGLIDEIIIPDAGTPGRRRPALCP